MAVFNEILAARFNRSLQKLFGIKGPPPVPQLASEVMAVHRIESGVENRYLEGWNMFGTAKFQAAVAANNLGWQLRNPTNSGVLVVIESLLVSAEGATAFLVSGSQGGALIDLTSIGVWTNLDGRIGNQVKGSALFSFQATTPATFTPIYNTSILAASANIQLIQNVNQEIPLAPNSLILVSTTVNNIGGEVSLRWRERPIEDSEVK